MGNRFTSDRRKPSESSWTDEADWTAGATGGVDVVGGRLVAQSVDIPGSVVTHYDFSNANNDTTAVVDQISNFNGTVSGASYVSDGGPDSNGAYSFKGNSDSISFGLPWVRDWSVVIKINFNDWNTSDRMVIWYHDNGGNIELVNEYGEFTIRGGNDAGLLSNGINVGGLSGYHTLGYVQNNSGGERVVYLDGSRMGSDSDTGDEFVASNDAYLGTGDATDLIADVADYKFASEALTDSEIQELS